MAYSKVGSSLLASVVLISSSRGSDSLSLSLRRSLSAFSMVVFFFLQLFLEC